MAFLMIYFLLPLAAVATCTKGDCACPSSVGHGLLQASKSSGHETLDGQHSSNIAQKVAQGVHVDLEDIGKYVESLAMSVVGHNHTMSNPEKAALKTIKDMVGKMRETAITQHREDQAEVGRVQGLIESCSSDTVASLGMVASFKQSSNSSRGAHASCRVAEVGTKAAKDAACSAYDSHRQVSTPPACMSTELSAGFVQTTDALKQKQMESCLEAVQGWLSPLYDKYDSCKLKNKTHENQTAECNSKQRALEQAFCAYGSKLEDVCHAQTTCRTRTIAARNSTHDGVKMSEAARKADIEASIRLRCFLGVFNTSIAHREKTLRECQKLKVNISEFDIVYPGIPAATRCSNEETKPCDGSWTQQEYQSQAWYANAPTVACVPCPAPTTMITTLVSTSSTTTTPANMIPIPGVRFYASMDKLTADSKLQDQSGNGNHGTIKMHDGSAASDRLIEQGGPGGGKFMNFARIHHVSLPSIDTLIMPGNEPRSVCYWERNGAFYRFAFGRSCQYDGIPVGSTFIGRYQLGFMGCGKDKKAQGGSALSDGKWHHVCYTYNRKTVKIFLDGQQKNSYSFDAVTTSARNGGEAVIGATTPNEGWSSFRGGMDEFYIIDHEVTDSELTWLRSNPVVK